MRPSKFSIGDGQVRVPLHSNVIVYAGRDAEVHHIQGRVTATAGRDLKLQDVQTAGSMPRRVAIWTSIASRWKATSSSSARAAICASTSAI